METTLVGVLLVMALLFTSLVFLLAFPRVFMGWGRSSAGPAFRGGLISSSESW